MDSKLRVGLLLDSYLLPAWAFTAIERIIRSNCAELALIILKQSSAKRRPALAAFWENRTHWLYFAFNVMDKKLFLRGQNALAQVDSSKILENVPVLRVKPVEENGEQYFSASDLEQIKSYELAILIKMGFGNLRGNALFATTYGVWTYRWGDHHKIENGLIGFWEVVRQCPETGAALQQLGVDAEYDRILFESRLFTYPYSPARSRNYVLWAASSFLPRQVERLFHLGGERFLQELKKDTVRETPKSLKTNSIPSNLQVMWIMMKLVTRNLLEIYRRNFYREQWGLLFNLGHNTENDFSTFKKISLPKNSFWADPHVIYKEPNYYIFVEEYPYRTKKGRISVVEMDCRGNCQKPVPVLQKDYHLSFPSVFEWRGHYYMIPESSSNRTIDLYECIDFPNRWQLKMTLMKDVKAVDTTLFHSQGKWWLFTAIAEQEAAAPQVELFLFYSDELFTDQWNTHPKNPIVSDVKRARAAGSIFVKNGRLFRPSQDCSKGYGYSVHLNEILILSETEYYEKTATTITPDWAERVIATHTYANQGNLIVIDALTRQPKWAKTA